MANMTRAEMIDFVLENLGVKSASQSASTEDGTRAGQVIDSVHAQLQYSGLAPFATSAIPDYAQVPFRDIASLNCAALFGISGERLMFLAQAEVKGRKDLAVQVSGRRTELPIKPYYF